MYHWHLHVRGMNEEREKCVDCANLQTCSSPTQLTIIKVQHLRLLWLNINEKIALQWLNSFKTFSEHSIVHSQRGGHCGQ